MQPETSPVEMVIDAIAQGEGLAGVDGAELINAITQHVAVLLGDALAAFYRNSYGTAVFLSITALEETVKAEVLAYRIQRVPDAKKRGRDPLRNHAQKHAMAIRPTTFMGRLPSILGDKACERLQTEAESGSFVELRERAIYAHIDGAVVSTPRTAISRDRALEMLLLACEAVDDAIVGYTNESMALGEQFSAWIEELRLLHNA